MINEAGPEFWKDGQLGKQTQQAHLLFGHVREDIDVELQLAQNLGNPRRAMVITSGGCSAIALRPFFSESVHSLDINPAQNYLAELKLSMISELPSIELLRSYHEENAEPALRTLRDTLSPGARSYWESNSRLLRRGVHRCGIIDRKLAFLRLLFHALVKRRSTVEDFFRLDLPDSQQAAYDSEWSSGRWRFAINCAFNPHFLRLVLRAGKVTIPSDLPSIMLDRFKAWLTSVPARQNRAACELFLGEFPEDWNYATPHLREDLWRTIRASRAKVEFVCSDAAKWLSARESRSLDLISLSNILEQSSADYRAKLLHAAEQALAADGLLIVRSILPWPPGFGVSELSEVEPAELPVENSGICNLVRVFRRN